MPVVNIVTAKSAVKLENDPYRIGAGNWSVMQNVKHSTGGPVCVSGYRRMCLLASPFMLAYAGESDGFLMGTAFDAGFDYATIGDSGIKVAASADDGYAIAHFNSTFVYAKIGDPGYTTITYVSGDEDVYFIDPSGSTVGLITSGAFPTGFQLTIVVTGSGAAVFDPENRRETLGAGESKDFYYDGTNWI